MAGFSCGSLKPLIHNFPVLQAEAFVSGLHQSQKRCREGHSVKNPIPSPAIRGPEMLPNQEALWSSDSAHGSYFAATLSKTPSAVPV